jgi:hypothetical protein
MTAWRSAATRTGDCDARPADSVSIKEFRAPWRRCAYRYRPRRIIGPSHRPSMARRLRCANDGFEAPICLSGRQRPRRTPTDTGRTCWLTGKASTTERFGYRKGETTVIEFTALSICSARPRRRRAANTPAASPGCVLTGLRQATC